MYIGVQHSENDCLHKSSLFLRDCNGYDVSVDFNLLFDEGSHGGVLKYHVLLLVSCNVSALTQLNHEAECLAYKCPCF